VAKASKTPRDYVKESDSRDCTHVFPYNNLTSSSFTALQFALYAVLVKHNR